MTRRIKRIAATIVAGILLVCVSFASFAEEAEEILDINADVADVTAVETEETISAAENEAEAEQVEDAEAETETVADAEAKTVESAVETVEDAAGSDESVAETAESAVETAEPAVTEETAQSEENTETQDIPAETETVTTEAGEGHEENYEFTEKDDSEYKELSDDAGYIDQAVVRQHIPEVTEELIAASEKYREDKTEETENIEADHPEETEVTAEETTETVSVKAWITAENDEVFIGDVLKLKANGQPELSGDVTWEIRNDLWDKDVWKQIETGSTLELEVTAENANDLIHFVTEDGTISESFRMNAAERIIEETAEITDGEAAITAGNMEASIADSNDSEDENRPESENEEPVNSEDTENNVINEPVAENTEEATEETADESGAVADEYEGIADEGETEATDAPAEETAVIRAWVDAAENEDGTIILTASADPELTGVSTWQIWDEDNAKWQKIGYGDQVSMETAEGQYRFVMQDGTISEVYEMAIPEEEETEKTEDPETEEEELAEETVQAEEEIEEERIPKIPEDRSVTAVMSWDDDHPGFGSVAHFSAELTGYEGLQYEFQWMMSADGVNWVPVEGETGQTMDIIVSQDNYKLYWRVDVQVTGVDME